MTIRWPFAAVERLVGDTLINDHEHRTGASPNRVGPPRAAALAARLGVPAKQIHRWRHTGLTSHRAGVIADSLGRHPRELWPDWLEVHA